MGGNWESISAVRVAASLLPGASIKRNGLRTTREDWGMVFWNDYLQWIHQLYRPQTIPPRCTGELKSQRQGDAEHSLAE